MTGEGVAVPANGPVDDRRFLAALFAVAVVVRLPALFNVGMPPFIFCDENMFLDATVDLLSRGEWTVREFRAGPLNIYPAVLIAKVLDAFGLWGRGAVLLLARLFHAGFLNPLAIWPLFAAARLLAPPGSRAPWWTAAAFVASPMVTGTSRILYPDHFLILFAAWFLLELVRVYRDPASTGAYVRLALAWALGCATKYTALAWVAPLGVLVLLRLWASWREGRPAGEVRSLAVRGAVFTVVAVSVWSLLDFSALLDPAGFRAAFEWNAWNYRREMVGAFNPTGVLYYVVVVLFLPFGITGVALLAEGGRRFASSDVRLFVVLASLPVLLVGYLGGTASTTIDRNMVPVLPVVLVWFGLGADAAWRAFRSAGGGWRRAAVGLLVFVPFAEMAGRSAYAFQRDLRTDSRELALEWVAANVPPDARIFHNEYCSGPSPVPATHTNVAFEPWVRFDRKVPDTFDVYISNSWWLGPFTESFRTGLVLQPDYPGIHFYNLGDRRPWSLDFHWRDYPPMPPEFELIDFEGSGPVVTIVRRRAPAAPPR